MRRETATKQWLLVLLAVLATCAAASTKTKMSPDPQEARADYIARVQQQMGTSQPAATLGSLWNPGAVYAEMGSDYKARNINDIVEIQVVEQTTASSTGDVDAERSFAASSGITALPGKLKVGGHRLYADHHAVGADHRRVAQQQHGGRGATRGVHEQSTRDDDCARRAPSGRCQLAQRSFFSGLGRFGD